MGKTTYQLVQDFSHQQYHSLSSSVFVLLVQNEVQKGWQPRGALDPRDAAGERWGLIGLFGAM